MCLLCFVCFVFFNHFRKILTDEIHHYKKIFKGKKIFKIESNTTAVKYQGMIGNTNIFQMLNCKDYAQISGCHS